MSKLVIYTDESGFNRAVNLYSQKVQVKQNIRMEIKKLIPDFKVTDDFYKDIELNFYNALGEAHPKHLELMKATKIPEILDLDIVPLMKLVSQYETVKDHKNPSISNYEIVAETKEEEKQFKVINKVIEAIAEAEEVLPTGVYKQSIEHAFKGWIKAELRNNRLVFNYNVISERKRIERRTKLLDGVVSS